MPRIQRGKNVELAPGVMKFTRSQMISKTGRFKVLGKGGPKKPAPQRPSRKARWYPAEDEPKPIPRSFKPKPTKLRSSIAPGQVLIVLTGPFRGKRVVFLRQLPSGLLLVTGPFKVNGVPLRRMNQAYVIATSSKVDVSGVSLPEQVTKDSFYVENKKEKEARRKAARSGEAAFFSKDDVKPQEIPQERKDIQKNVDEQLLALPEFQDKVFKAYVGAKFTLTRGQYPHDMKF